LRSMSEPLQLKESDRVTSAELPAIELEDAALRFNLRFYKKRLTLRGTAIGGLYAITRRQRRRGDEFWALQGVTLTLAKGEVLGVIGSNGAGKSTLLRLIAGIYAPDRGRVTTRGTIATLLSFGAGFDLRRPGSENIQKNGVLLGLTKQQVAERMESIIEMSGLGDFIDAQVMTYSSGMRARLGFSIAVNVDPDILLIDEVVGAGDERFRNRVGNIFDQLSDSHKAVVFVTHAIPQIEQYCTRAIWLDHGRIRLDGSPREVAAAYLEASRSGA